MLNGVTAKIRDWLGACSFETDLKRQLKNDPWLRQTYISVNLYLTSAESAENSLTAQVIQTQMDDDFRRMIGRVAGLRLLGISKASNKTRECRAWILAVMGEYSALRALYTPTETYEPEVKEGIRHEATKGLYESFDAFAPKVYSQYFPSKTYQGTTENNEELRRLSLAYEFWTDVGNFARIGLDDRGLWFRQYFAICVAMAEANLRSTSESGYLAAVLSDEREAMRRELLGEAA